MWLSEEETFQAEETAQEAASYDREVGRKWTGTGTEVGKNPAWGASGAALGTWAFALLALCGVGSLGGSEQAKYPKEPSGCSLGRD